MLFYWYILRKEYSAFAYISLSEKILKSPKQYAMAYIYSEQDNNDLNYFIDYNIMKLKLARQDFQNYIKRKITENRQIAHKFQDTSEFNTRQIKLMLYFLKENLQYTTLQQHKLINHIGKVTAATDLRVLVEKGLLEKHRNGRNIFYYPTDKIKDVLKSQ